VDEFEEGLDEFYALRGWDATTGWPKRETLLDLGLGDGASDLERRNLLP